MVMKYVRWVALLMLTTQWVVANDVEVRFHESVVNSAIQVVGPLTGKGDLDTPLGKKSYTWTISNPRVVVQPDGLGLVADTAVDLSGFKYSTVTSGTVGAQMNPSNSKMDIRLRRASFALDFVVFGNRIHLTDIDVSGAFSQTFSISVPTFNQTIVIPATSGQPTTSVYLRTGTPNIDFQPPFLVVGAPLIVEPRR